jgi:hypothetical protein
MWRNADITDPGQVTEKEKNSEFCHVDAGTDTDNPSYGR